MKKLIFSALVTLLMVSCLGEGPAERHSYTLQADFELSDAYSHQKFYGSDSLFFDADGGVGIAYDFLAFLHKLDEKKTKVEGGFVCSCFEYSKEDQGKDLVNTWRAYAELLEGQTRTSYLVYHDNPDEELMPEHSMHFTAIDYGTCQMIGCYVTNTVEVAEAVAENFEKGDKLILKAVGYLDGQRTGRAEISLADFSAKKDSIVSVWTPFDLSALGAVEYIDFSIESDKEAVPEYACIDFVCANIAVEY